MGNSPRYIGFIEPPYTRTFTDQSSGAVLDLTGCVSSNFTLTMLKMGLSKLGAGVWTVLNQATNKGQASYQWTLSDVDTSGFWEIYTTVKLPAEPEPREMDPEVIQFLAGTVGAGAAPPGVLPSPVASLPFLNIRDFGGIGDGLSDNTTPIFNARAAARALGGARILYGPGTFISGNQDISNDAFVYHEGSGEGTTIIELKNGANTDLFSGQVSSINLSAPFGTGPNGSLHHFGFSKMTLDGNKANQSSGTSYPLRVYGYDFTHDDLTIRNGYSGGPLIDWNGSGTPGDGPEGEIGNLRVHDNNGIGLRLGGPNGTQINRLEIYSSGSHNFHVAPNAGGIEVAQMHLYGPGQGNSSVNLLCEAGGFNCSSASCEGSDTVNVVVLGNSFQWRGLIFGEGVLTCSALQFGQQAGQTPYSGQLTQAAGVTTAVAPLNCDIQVTTYNCQGAHGALWWANDNSGGNKFQLIAYQGAGNYVTGAPSQNSFYEIIGLGLTADGTLAKSGGVFYPGGADYALYSASPAGAFVRVSTNGNIGSIYLNGSIYSASTFAFERTQTIATAGIIAHSSYYGIVAVSSTTNVTGVILEAAYVIGGANMMLTVINTGNFSITFAASGTSHVAGGASVVIAAGAKLILVWDSNTNLWY